MKLKDQIRDIFEQALLEMGAPVDFPLVIEKPKLKAHGDLATPLAMTLAKRLGSNPMQLAEKIVKVARLPRDVIADVQIAKPGFINLTLANPILTRNLIEIINRKDAYGSSNVGGGAKLQVEYVSANPTGPLVIVSARAAAIGSVLVNLLSFVGYDAESEYYVNDFGQQLEALGASLRYRLKERFGSVDPREEIGSYPGEYVRSIAAGVPAEEAQSWINPETQLSTAQFGKIAAGKLLESIKRDLRIFGVEFKNFFYESSLHPDAIDGTLKLLGDKGYTYEKEGAIFFGSSRLGDEKDRVLKKSDGDATYFLGDIAYHYSKLRRNYERVIDIWGPDHHGHIPRMKAAAQVLGASPGWLEVIILGWVRLVEGDRPVSMSKRAGEFISMRELVDDVGSDVAKYFFLMRRTNSPLDFDLELARKQSEENPVYYVQYAHARISSVIRFAKEKGVSRNESEESLDLLSTGEERDLMLHLTFFPYVVEAAAEIHEPHRLTVYAQELATLFHQFYHECRIVSDDERLSGSRLLLAEATMQVLRNALTLMGVKAPESM